MRINSRPSRGSVCKRPFPAARFRVAAAWRPRGRAGLCQQFSPTGANLPRVYYCALQDWSLSPYSVSVADDGEEGFFSASSEQFDLIPAIE